MSEGEGKNISVVNLGSLTKPVDTATKGIVDGAAAFLSRICLPASEEIGLLFKDKVSYWRAMNMAKILKKAENKLKTNYREISPKLILPLIEGASLEENEELQDLWANLLSSALDPNFKGTIRSAYIDIIKQLEVIDVHVLNTIYQGYRQWRDQVSADYDKEKNFHFSPIGHSIDKYELIGKLEMLLAGYESSIDNLIRVRCVAPFVENKLIDTEVWDNRRVEEVTIDHGYERVRMTTLGVDFVEACIG